MNEQKNYKSKYEKYKKKYLALKNIKLLGGSKPEPAEETGNNYRVINPDVRAVVEKAREIKNEVYGILENINKIVNLINSKCKELSDDKDFQTFRKWFINGNITFDGNKPKCKYVYKRTDGCVASYIGCVNDEGQYHGKGILFTKFGGYSNSEVLEGIWQNGRPAKDEFFKHYKNKDDYKEYKFFYCGNLTIDFKKEGKGKIIYTYDNYYGEWKNNKMHGFGSMKVKDANRNGFWKGKFDKNSLPFGIFDTKNKCCRYVGEFDTFGKVIYQGIGTMFMNNKIEYEGQFNHNNYEGLGLFYFTNHEKYEGDFVKDKFQGKGVHYFDDGLVRYRGDYVNGKKHGEGISNYKYEDSLKLYPHKIDFDDPCFRSQYNGISTELTEFSDKKTEPMEVSNYNGFFRENLFHGKGKMVLVNEDKFEGKFYYGTIQGKGILKDRTSVKYDGLWFNNQQDPEGKLEKNHMSLLSNAISKAKAIKCGEENTNKSLNPSYKFNEWYFKNCQ